MDAGFFKLAYRLQDALQAAKVRPFRRRQDVANKPAFSVVFEGRAYLEHSISLL